MRYLKVRSHGHPLENEPRSKRLMVIRVLYLGAVLALGLWLGNFLLGDRIYLRSEGLVLGEPAMAAAEYAVTVRDITVKDGQIVKAGDQIAVVSSQAVAETIARLTSDVTSRVVRESELRIRKEVIGAMMPFAEHRRQFASDARKQYETLTDRGYLSLNQHAAALESEYRGVQDFEAMQAEERAIESELLNLNTALTEARSAIAELRKNYDDGTVRAPIDGIVTKVAATKGSVARAGEPLIELSGTDRFVLAYVPTGVLYSVQEGDQVTVKAGLHASRGIITRIEPFAAALPREFQRAFTPVERQQVVRVAFLPGESVPPLFSKVAIRRASSSPWLGQIVAEAVQIVGAGVNRL